MNMLLRHPLSSLVVSPSTQELKQDITPSQDCFFGGLCVCMFVQDILLLEVHLELIMAEDQILDCWLFILTMVSTTI